jgi:hypothetical protein
VPLHCTALTFCFGFFCFGFGSNWIGIVYNGVPVRTHGQVYPISLPTPTSTFKSSKQPYVHPTRTATSLQVPLYTLPDHHPHQLNFFIIPPQRQRSPSRAVAPFIPASFFCLYHPPTYLPQVSPFITIIHLQICRAALHAPSTIPPILSFFVHLHRPPT